MIVTWTAGVGSHAIAVVGGYTAADGVARYVPSDPLTPDAAAHTFVQLVANYCAGGRLENAWFINP